MPFLTKTLKVENIFFRNLPPKGKGERRTLNGLVQ